MPVFPDLSFSHTSSLPPHPVSCFTDRRPDKDKNEEELRVELGQLRDVWRMDQDELKKLHAVRDQADGTHWGEILSFMTFFGPEIVSSLALM